MRHPFVFAALLGLLGATAPALAQSYPAEAVIQQEVEARSGPSKTFFPTSRLLRGDKVVVIRECKESSGWLEIKPPAGSFSWINGKYVKQIDGRYAVVDADPGRPAPVLPGSTLVNQEPNRESIKLTTGTIVIIVDRPLSINGDSWLPIQPHPSEVRYIPVEAVRGATQIAATTNAAPNWTLAPTGFMGNPALAEAEQARKAGDLNKARQLYQQVANTATDQNQKVFALTQLNSLSQGPNPPIQSASSQKQGGSVSAYSPPNSSVPVNLITTKTAAWSKYGRLRETSLKREDGQPLYVLEDEQGRPLTYVATAPGKTLQQYQGRIVSVFGPTMYRPDSAVRLEYVVASHVAVP